ncbi:MAG TPA: ABC transporter ATP-binding protein [Dehalococcoidia bacterium]|nr:ABC transporter ATP-binding protein [Dehalococcoidia bacterium]
MPEATGAAVAAAPAIVLGGVTKRYRNGALANDGIELTIPRGAVFALLGPNGAGKTTLVRQITAELKPTSGEIELLGVDVLREPLRAKRLMGVVPQEALPYMHMRPSEHLRLFGRLRGLSGRQADVRAEALLDALDLRQHDGKQARHLSGGLRRKLLVGMAMVAEPEVLILDEPTTGLDPHSRREVWSLIRDIRDQGSTVLITTHYMDEAEELSDSVAVIGSGRILALGSVDELRARCRNRFKGVYQDERGQRQVVYGQSQREVAEQLERAGAAEYSLMRASLEDLYLELTGTELGEAEVA